MTALGMIAVVLSFLVLGAHFLRDGNMVMVAVSLFLPLLLLVPKALVARLLQVALLLAGIEWLWTLYTIAQERAAAGVPYTRTVIILAGVALFTVASAFAFHLRGMRRRYELDR
jgi:hypothetical protein